MKPLAAIAATLLTVMLAPTAWAEGFRGGVGEALGPRFEAHPQQRRYHI
jgi:hypothetical protein